MANKKQLSQANGVRDNGQTPLGNPNYNGKNFNPIGVYIPSKDKYISVWEDYDRQQMCSRFKWENLPNGLTSWNIERMLYFRGCLVGFKSNDIFYILPFVPQGLNVYGMPVSIIPIPFNGSAEDKDGEQGVGFFGEDFKLPINNAGDFTDDCEAVLLYDRVPVVGQGNLVSRYMLNRSIIQDMADVLARVNINVVVSNKKIILQVKDAGQKTMVEKQLAESFGSGSPFTVITTPIETKEIQQVSDFQCDDLFNTIKNYDAIRCFTSGIIASSFGAEKKERLISGELEGNDVQVNLVEDIMLEMRQEFVDKVNEVFGLSITVSKRSSEYEETDGNGQTEDDKDEQDNDKGGNDNE